MSVGSMSSTPCVCKLLSSPITSVVFRFSSLFNYSSLCLVCHEMLTEELPEKTEKLPTNVNELKKFFEDHRKEIAKRMSRATFIALGEPVNDFERIVRQKLKPLPSGWVVLTNGRFKRLDKKGANPKDIDVVILTPYQAYSIEIRSYKSFNGEKIKILIDNTKESYNCLKEINNTIDIIGNKGYLLCQPSRK